MIRPTPRASAGQAFRDALAAETPLQIVDECIGYHAHERHLDELFGKS